MRMCDVAVLLAKDSDMTEIYSLIKLTRTDVPDRVQLSGEGSSMHDIRRLCIE